MRESTCTVKQTQQHLLTEAWHPGFVEDYVHEGDLKREPLRLISSGVHCCAPTVGLNVMNK